MTALVKPHFKKLGLIVTSIGILLFILLNVLNIQYDEAGRFEKIMNQNHFIIIFGFLMLTFSKEKMDDERIQKIRYFATNICLRMLIILIPTYILITDLDRVPFSVYPIFYIIEGILIFYQVVFRIGIRTSPKRMFEEPTKGNSGFYIVFFILLFLIAMLIIDVLTHKIQA